MINGLSKVINQCAMVFVIMFLASNSVFAQVGNDITNSSNVTTQLQNIWKWVIVVFSIGFFILLIVGGFDVYAKSQSEDKDAFKKAAMGWGKGLIFLIVFFAVVSALIAAWNALKGQMTL